VVTGGRGLAERLGRLPSSPWFAYPAVLLVQVRALWGIWHDDLSPGDTAGYWQWADLWFDHEKVNIAWSPLYTAGLGTLRWLTGDDATVAIPLHRALIALAYARDVAPKARQDGLPAALQATGADALYADATMLADPGVARLVAASRRSGWRLVGAGKGDAGRWAVLVRRDAPFTRPPQP
jgi:hypothetical protein